MQLACCIAIAVTVFPTEAFAIKPGRMFKRQVSTRRTDAPRSTTNARFEVSCASRCYGEWWCQAFNLNPANQQCDLFDSTAANGQLVSDPDFSYSEKASKEMRVCHGLPVENGENVPSGTASGVTADISCNPYYETNETQVICHDGAFRPADSTGAVAAIKAVKCDFTCPTDGMRLSRDCLKFVNLAGDKFGDAVSACAAIKDASLAVALPNTVRQFTGKQIPAGSYAYVGLVEVGLIEGNWQWVNSGNLSDTVDTRMEHTVAPIWHTDFLQPNAGTNEPYGVLTHHTIDSGVAGLADVEVGATKALCQIADMNYVFVPVERGKRISSPTERSVNGTDVEGCRQSCLTSVFCRAFSYSISESVCLQHSLPPTETETSVVDDVGFTLYA